MGLLLCVPTISVLFKEDGVVVVSVELDTSPFLDVDLQKRGCFLFLSRLLEVVVICKDFI